MRSDRRYKPPERETASSQDTFLPPSPEKENSPLSSSIDLHPVCLRLRMAFLLRRLVDAVFPRRRDPPEEERPAQRRRLIDDAAGDNGVVNNDGRLEADDSYEIINRFLAELEQENPSVEALLNLVREYGGDGDILLVECRDDFMEQTPFNMCIRSLSEETLLNLLRALSSEYPGLSSKQDQYRETLLHLAVEVDAGAPLALVHFLLQQNRDALTTPDRVGCLPIHLALSERIIRTIPVNFETVRLLVEANPSTLQHRDYESKLPLHHACERLDNVTNGTHQAMEAIEFIITAYPEALEASDEQGNTPIMTAIAASWAGGARHPDQLHLLQWMIQRGGKKALRDEYTDREGRIVCNTALHVACCWWADKALLLSLIEADPDAPTARDVNGWLPLHVVCSQCTAGTRDVLEAIEFLSEAFPVTLEARDNNGESPIMTAMKHAGPDVEVSRQAVEILKAMIQLAPASVRGTFNSAPSPDDPPLRRTVLESVCTFRGAPELTSFVLQAWPIALCVSLTGTLNNVPEDVALIIKQEARDVFLAMLEVLLHDTTQGVVPEPIRVQVRRLVCRLLPPEAQDRGGFVAAQVIRSLVHGQAFQQLRSDVLTTEALGEYLLSHESFQDLITGVYRMNKAGRSDGSNEVGDRTVESPAPVGRSRGEHDSATLHLSVLESAMDDLSCVFLHLRDCCGSLLGRDDGKPAAAVRPGPVRVKAAE
jgi:ankyrin repeat protein